jgi:DNA polymerase-3 subunit delta
MSSDSPSIYLLYGSDEFAIRSFLDERLKARMGEGADAAMDITSLDGKTANLEAIRGEALTVPFLAQRRMVVLTNPLALCKGKTNQSQFIELLASVPPSTALVLIEDRSLEEKHWLVRWCREHPDQARQLGGEFAPPAAQLLGSYLDEDPRLAKSEINKLLTYVDFSREVTEEDVLALVADVRQGDVFEMVDAIGYGDGEKAMFMLRRLLEEGEALPLFGMVVRQFRLLIQVRELLEMNPGQDHFQIAERMGSHPYPIQKILPQARLFDLGQLKAIYHQLSEVDRAIKTGQLDGDLALDLLVASLTG